MTCSSSTQACCCRWSRTASAGSTPAPAGSRLRRASPSEVASLMQLDVFTLVPHAFAVLTAIARRLSGALAEGSGEVESFSAELGRGLEYPHYTRPAEFRGWRVPGVLLSGDHAKIEGWRREQVR